MGWTVSAIGVGNRLALGRAWVLEPYRYQIRAGELAPDALDGEIARLDAAIADLRAELDAMRSQVGGDQRDVLAFLTLQEQLLEDPLLIDEAKQRVRDEACSIETALVQQLKLLLGHFDQIDDPYLRERRVDVEQLVERILRSLSGEAPASSLIPPPTDAMTAAGEGWILIAHDLSPGDILRLRESGLAGFVLDGGSPTAHTAILARSLGLPALVGAGSLTAQAQTGELILIDPASGEAQGGLSEAELATVRARLRDQVTEESRLQTLLPLASETLDGTQIHLFANIDLPEDVAPAVALGCHGVGLFRSEFLYMNRPDLPSEETQFQSYSQALKALGGKTLTVRTLDAGADKPLPQLLGQRRVSANPALSLRAVRLCLAEPEVFRTQLRAILRASALGPIRMMIPLVSGPTEVVKTRQLLLEAQAQLRSEGKAFNSRMPVGIMVELPSAALNIDGLVAHIDFASIGTNDLIQYTLAVDRTDPSVANYYEPLNPAVLRLIYRVIQTCRRAELPVSLCGEMAGEPELVPLLLGMGLTEFSMPAVSLLRVKDAIRRYRLEALTGPVRRLLRLPQPEMIRAGLAQLIEVNEAGRIPPAQG